MRLGKSIRRVANSYFILLSLCVDFSSSLSLTFLHTNDVHSRIEEIDKYGSMCKHTDRLAKNCYGGIARIASKVTEIKRSTKNVILLDGGDQQTGTLWYDVFKGNATAHFVNKLRYDAVVS